VLDYQGDNVALREFAATLSAASFSDPALANAKAKALAAVAASHGEALLGAFVHQLLEHAASDGKELALLRRAADLWRRGVALYNELSTIRADLEGAMEHPTAPGAADRFNAAAVSVQKFAHRANVIRVEIDAFRADALAFPHLPRHPRQQDRDTSDWDWGNLTLARRTDAFVRGLLRRAGDQSSLAFAIGACASYGAHIAGSAYIGQTVGGPRRSHRYRDRLARNAFGSWLSAHHAAALPPSVMAHRITFGPPSNPALPTELVSLIHGTLGHSFDTTRTKPLPDMQLGYRRLVEHLRLLEGFVSPPVPTPPAQRFMATLFADPQNPPPSLRPQDIDVNGQDGGGVAVSYGPSGTGSGSPDGSDSGSTSKGCGIAVFAIIALDLIQAFVQCIGQWANHHTCTFWDNMLLKKVWEQDPPDPHDPTHPEDPNVTAAKLTAISSSPQAAQLVWMLFDLHSQAWEAIDRAYVFLAVTGLIYPGHLTAMPLYAQFTSLPDAKANPWPHREVSHPADHYHLYPSSPLEHPTEEASPAAAGSMPDVYLGQAGGNAMQISLELWRQVAAGEHDTENRDLDADRGFDHPCWAARGSVSADPVDVVVLAYDEQ
jgi:hypothetical protein